MKTRKIQYVTLREGESAVCDCCGAELRKYAVVGVVGCIGRDCWDTAKGLEGYVKYQQDNPNRRPLSATESRALPFLLRYLAA